MVELRAEGLSFDEIGRRFGISRERVRQILRARGDVETGLAARRGRAAREADARVDELLALWRSGTGPASAATALGLQAAACRSTIDRFATHVDRAARRASISDARGPGARAYTDRDILVALRTVAERTGRTPSLKEYAAAARELKLPSVQTVLNRMGGWTTAVRAAGIEPAAAPSRGRQTRRRWTEEACWDALRRVVRELGKVPSVVAYDRHAADRGDLPSSATIRNRLGRWSAIATRLAAERELAALHPLFAG